MVPVDFSRACIGIIGLGGLGSNIAIMFARAGISNLRLADFDKVELDNLNRQHYFPVHVGLAKTEALARQLRTLLPSINLELWNQKIEPSHLENFCEKCDIIIEAVDGIESKASILSWFEERPLAPWLVTASGVAGLGPAREIQTILLADRIIACGDFSTPLGDQEGLWAPRVMIVASQQALAALRILKGLAPV